MHCLLSGPLSFTAELCAVQLLMHYAFQNCYKADVCNTHVGIEPTSPTPYAGVLTTTLMNHLYYLCGNTHNKESNFRPLQIAVISLITTNLYGGYLRIQTSMSPRRCLSLQTSGVHNSFLPVYPIWCSKRDSNPSNPYFSQ